MTFAIPNVPSLLTWHNQPVEAGVQDGALTVSAGPQTDLFADPAGGRPTDNAPVALFTPPDRRFVLSAKVGATFAAAFDAGALQIRDDAGRWAKLAFEVSPQLQPMVVSVVTRGVSDDCNGVVVDTPHVHLRLAVAERTIAFHWSSDGSRWDLVRYFSLGDAPPDRQIGFSAQSPTGAGCRATFAEISYRAGELGDLRDGT